jgi:hypothetical protein
MATHSPWFQLYEIALVIENICYYTYRKKSRRYPYPKMFNLIYKTVTILTGKKILLYLRDEKRAIGDMERNS